MSHSWIPNLIYFVSQNVQTLFEFVVKLNIATMAFKPLILG